MKRLWSPWRSRYIASFARPRRRRGSLFTAALAAKNDNRHYIVWRGSLCFVILNLYPYNSGHLMVVPYRQTSRFTDLTPEELVEIMEAARRAMHALDRVMKPQGYNLGANIGRAAGAGVDDHVHFHIVPRWNGDTNFLPVLGETKVISQSLRDTLRKLRAAFADGPPRKARKQRKTTRSGRSRT